LFVFLELFVVFFGDCIFVCLHRCTASDYSFGKFKYLLTYVYVMRVLLKLTQGQIIFARNGAKFLSRNRHC